MEHKIDAGQNETLLVKLSGDITIYQVDKFKEVLAEVKRLEAKIKNVVLDLSGVGFIDSLALGALTTFAREVRDDGGDVKLAGLTEEVRALFELTRLSETYEIYKDAKKAAKSYGEYR